MVYFVPKLTDKAKRTRERILESASRTFYQHGYNATGLDKVIKAAGITKGNFYYYFPSKEALGVETLRWQRMKATEQVGFDKPLNGASPFQHLLDLLGQMKQVVSSGDPGFPIRGCYFGNFTLELSSASEPVRKELDVIFNAIRTRFRELIAMAQSEGEVNPALNPSDAATTVLSLFEGAIILSKASQDPKQLDIAIDAARHYLTK